MGKQENECEAPDLVLSCHTFTTVRLEKLGEVWLGVSPRTDGDSLPNKKTQKCPFLGLSHCPPLLWVRCVSQM